MAVRILLVDDHKIFREGMRLLIESQTDLKVVGEAGDGHAAVDEADRLNPDVIIMDIALPNLNGIEATKRILSTHDRIRILALSVHSDKTYVSEMLTAGAKGYLPKKVASDELITAIQSLMKDQFYLSPLVTEPVIRDLLDTKTRKFKPQASLLTAKEREVLQLIAEGNSSKDIAELLGVSARTVEAHRAKIMKKLNLSGIAEMTKYAIAHGMVSADS